MTLTRYFTYTSRLSKAYLTILQSILQLVKSSGAAIDFLRTIKSSDSSTPLSPAARRQAIENETNSYLKTLQSVDVRLGRQIHGLEEEGIIPPDKGKAKPKANSSGSDILGPVKPGGVQGPKSEEVAVEGSMGKLDISWLNSRSGRVGRDNEMELWEQSRVFLEELKEGKYKGKSIPQNQPDGDGDDEEMEDEFED